MKSFVLQLGLYGVSKLELIPGVWHVGCWLGKQKAKSREIFMLQRDIAVDSFLKKLQSEQSPLKTSSPQVVGMVGGQGAGKTHHTLRLCKMISSYNLDVNDIRLYLEEKGLDQSNAKYVAFIVTGRLVALGHNVVIDMSHDLALTRGYMEEVVTSWAGDYSGRVTFSYRQNDVTWEQVEKFMRLNVPAWYGVAAGKRFPGLSGADLRGREARGTF